MPSRALALDADPAALERVVRILSASVNVRMLRALAAARKVDPRGGWVCVTDIARDLDEAPGTVSVAAAKLMPLLEERREKGKRYFRSRVRALSLNLETWDSKETPLI